MDFELTDEQRLVKETARAFTDNEIVARARENDRSAHFDLDLVQKIPEQGYLGAIVRRGTKEQKQRYLPKLCSGEWLGCFGLTEPDTGSDAANQKTRARRTPDGWVINGAKMWISMGNHACPRSSITRWACTAPPPPRSASTTVTSPATRCSAASAAAAMSSLDSGRYSVAAGCVGICQGCMDRSVDYAKERVQFGRPTASFQLARAMLADMKVQTDAARMLTWRAGALKDAGKPNPTETSIAKLYATEAAVTRANTAIQVHGGSGYVEDHPVERYFRDVRVTTLYEGTSQIQKLIIGRALTGINALVPS